MSETITSWLDLVPAQKDTSGSNTKWDSLQPCTDNKKTRTTINVPASGGYINPPYLNSGTFPRLPTLQFKYNYTAPQPFTLLDYPFKQLRYSFNTFQGVILFTAIAWRIGTTFKRYFLCSPDYITPILGLDYRFQQFMPLYGGQVIGEQFCIEFWGSYFTYNMPQLSLNTSITGDPVNVGDVGPAIQPSSGLIMNDIFVNLPQNLPINWPADVLWNSN